MWRLAFVAAENSMGFRTPQELARTLGKAIDGARRGQLEAVPAPGAARIEPLAQEAAIS